MTNELARVTTAGTVSSETRCDLLRHIAALGLTGPITLVLDNARDQRCTLVTSVAATLHITLEFLPSYSPNLNLIERLWKFVQRDVLSGRHDNTFTDFRRAIDGCLDHIPTKHRPQLATRMTHNFQHFNTASFLAA